MFTSVKLTRGQFDYFAQALKTIAEATIIGSSAAFFLPEALQLERHISVGRYFFLSLIGLIVLIIGAIIHKQGKAK